jgi:cobalt-zinc-cadmium efflux system protein
MSHSLEQKILPCLHAHRPLLNELKESEAWGMESAEDAHHHELTIHRPQQRRALLFCILLTAVMMIVEFAAGWLTGSLMLISDAIHMLSHASALGISLFAVLLAQRATSDELPFGLYRIEILAALLNGLGLAGFSLWIMYESILRILHPVAILGSAMTAVALIGLTVNLITAVILRRSGLEDLNTKSAFLHMLADTFSSVAIVVGGLVLSFTDWVLIDPLLSLAVAGVVVKWSWDLLRTSTLILLERKPDHLHWRAIHAKLRQEFSEIKNIHDSHVWEITSQLTCLSAHIVLEDMQLSEAHRLQTRIAEYLKRQFGIGHVVLQVEC